MSVLLDEETVVLDALDFTVECWHEGHGAEWSVACRFCAQCVFLCDSHLSAVRLRFLDSLASGRNPRCVKCQTRGESFDALFEAVPL